MLSDIPYSDASYTGKISDKEHCNDEKIGKTSRILN